VDTVAADRISQGDGKASAPMKNKKKPPPQDQFVALRFEMKEAAAWRAMSASARLYYLELKSEHRPKKQNNGEIFLSQREAAKRLGMNRTTIINCHGEVIHYGFVVVTTPGCLGIDGKGKAPHLRLTELDTDEPATKDYLDWNGEIYVDPRKSEKRKSKNGAGRSPKKNKNPVGFSNLS
jgi:hypothetical protein